jgi:hypothetical protein
LGQACWLQRLQPFAHFLRTQSGVEVPAVRPTTLTPRNQAGCSSSARATWYAGRPCRRANGKTAPGTLPLTSSSSFPNPWLARMSSRPSPGVSARFGSRSATLPTPIKSLLSVKRAARRLGLAAASLYVDGVKFGLGQLTGVRLASAEVSRSKLDQVVAHTLTVRFSSLTARDRFFRIRAMGLFRKPCRHKRIRHGLRDQNNYPWSRVSNSTSGFARNREVNSTCEYCPGNLAQILHQA